MKNIEFIDGSPYVFKDGRYEIYKGPVKIEGMLDTISDPSSYAPELNAKEVIEKYNEIACKINDLIESNNKMIDMLDEL
jgi:hypothetical protein